MNKDMKTKIIVIIAAVLIIGGLVFVVFRKIEKPQTSGGSEDLLWIGKADAVVTLIEYYNYFCTHCKNFEDQIMPDIIRDYVATGKVKFVFRPLSTFIQINEGVLCANDQNKFLEYHNYIFSHLEGLQKTDDLKVFARNVDLNETQFNNCMDSNKFKIEAENYYRIANEDFTKAKIPSEQQGTPTFLIAGEMLVGNQTYDKLKEVIEKNLK